MISKRVVGWVFVGIGVLLLVVMAGGILVLRSQRFHEYVLATIEQKAAESTGGKVTVQNYDFHWRNLSADVYGLVIHGREPAGTQPLLSVDRLFVDVRIISVLRKEVDLNEIIVHHPVVRFVSYADGTNNVPRPKTPKQSSNTNIFDLGIKHVLLTNGEIYYQQQKQDLNADLHNLHTEVTYVTAAGRYDGTISYDEGELRWGGARPMPHSLRAQFTVDRNHADLQSATLSLGQSRVYLNAYLENFSAPKLNGAYRVVLYPQDLREALKNPDLPSGEITVAGSLNYDNADQRPFLRAVAAQGKLSSPELLVNTAQARAKIQAVRGDFQFSDGKLTTALNAGLLAGHFAAVLDVTHLDTTPASYLKATLTGISLAEARSALRSARARDFPVTGKLDAYTEASWKGPLSTMRARADLALKAAIDHKPSHNIVPVNGAVHANYDGASNIVTVRDTMFRTPQSSISMDGQLSRHSNLKIVARTRDVGELSALASSMPSTTGGAPPEKNFEVSGPAVLGVNVQGDMKRPQLSGNINAHDLTVQGDRWRSLDATFRASPSGVTVSNGSLVPVGQGEALFSLSVGLRDWEYSPNQPLAGTLQVRQMRMQTLQHAAGLNYPLTGILTANFNVKGTQLDPVGNGVLTVSQARVYEQRVQDVTLHLQAANQTIHSDLLVRTPAGNLNGTFSFQPRTKAYEVHLKAPGVVLAKLDVARDRNLPLNGTATIDANGAGTLDNPQLQASIQIPQLQIRDASVQSVRTNLNVANHRAQFDLSSDFAKSFIQGRGNVELRGNYPADISLDTRAIPIETLVALYKPLPNRDFHGEIELHATARGPLKDKNRMEAHVTIPTLRAAYQDIQIANAAPIRADYQNAVLRLQPSQIQGTGTSLRFEGTVPVAGSQPASLNLVGTVDMQIVRLVSPDVQSRGTIGLDLRANRTAGNLGVGGQIRLNKVSFATLSSPLGIQNLNGTLDVQDNQVRITDLKGQTGGGTISAGGTISYRPQIAMNVSLEAKGVRLRYPDGVRAVIDSNLALSGDLQDANLNGRVLLNSLGFTSDFDLAEFMGQFSGNATSAPSPGFAQNTKLNVAVQSTSDLQLVSSELSLEGQVNLRVTGTAAQPVIVGRTTLNNGDIFFMKRRYRLERAIIDFINPNETQPNVNVLITTKINQYDLSLTLLGPVDRLRTTYISDPPLPPVDIINLIARGQTTEESTPANFDANAVLAQGLASQVSSRLEKFAGLSSLQIDPVLGGNNDNPGARIAIQQRVTRNFMFTFSSDVTNSQREIVQGEYQINPRWSVSALRDENGGYAVDARFHKIF